MMEEMDGKGPLKKLDKKSKMGTLYIKKLKNPQGLFDDILGIIVKVNNDRITVLTKNNES